ncbi:MAG: hypothetical protein AB7F89_23835, partial [Pirellulaceae bacterium]
MKRLTCWLSLFAAAAGCLSRSAEAQTAYPMLMSLQPVAARIGHTTEHTLKSRYSMFDTFDVLVAGSGVRGEVVMPEAKPGETPNLQEMKIRFTVATEALPGVRDFRIVTPRGASTIGQLVVVHQPVVVEQRDNNTLEQAQVVALPAAICGAVERNEDVDFFRFHAEAGQSFSFHVRSMRLQDRIHDLQSHIDPILTIRNEQGTTVAANDNYFYGDPFLHHRFERAGDYFLELRDVRYKGNQYWEYCVEVTDQPFVTAAFPAAVGRGQVARLQLVGYQLPSEPAAILRVDDAQPCGVQDWPLPLAGSQANPVAVVVSDQPVFVEQPVGNDTAASAQVAMLPTQLTGRIERDGDIDCFRFAALKGESYSFEVWARRQGSAMDSHLRILDAEGKSLALNDDLRMGKRGSSDSLIEGWTAPADGMYVVEVRDLHGRGGANFVYTVAATRAAPGFRLWIDTDKTQLTPGTSSVLFVRCERLHGFAGEIQLHIDELPPSVTASCGRILAGGQDGCIVLTADDDAPWQASNVRVRGTAVPPASTSAEAAPSDVAPIVAEARCYQEIYQPGGGRGHWPADMHTVCV